MAPVLALCAVEQRRRAGIQRRGGRREFNTINQQNEREDITMKRTTCLTSLCAAVAVLALPLTGTAQQYRNSATGQTFNNSLSGMISVTSTMMQDFTRQQSQYLNNTARMTSAYSSPSAPAQPAQAQPVLTQTSYPITATDFQGIARRELPPLLLQQMKGVSPQQKAALRQMYYQLLTDYEQTNRPGNVACAMAYAIRVSLEINRGRELSPAEADYLIQFLNNALANASQFNAMTPQQKQIIYESSILTAGTAAVLYVEGQQQRNAMFQLQARQIAQSVLRQSGIYQ
jgi:hypothetical protein